MPGRKPGQAWLADRRMEVAADRILDAAERLFAEREPGSVGMHEIAFAAGCSRATLYRYFENREALHTAYVHRWANTLYRRLTDSLAGITDPHRRLVAGITESLALVRENPALASWFAKTGPPIGAAVAEESDVVATMVAGFLAGLDPGLSPADGDAADVFERRARWMVRVMTSLLIFPGRDADDERAMLEEFVVPVVAPAEHAARRR